MSLRKLFLDFLLVQREVSMRDWRTQKVSRLLSRGLSHWMAKILTRIRQGERVSNLWGYNSLVLFVLRNKHVHWRLASTFSEEAPESMPKSISQGRTVGYCEPLNHIIVHVECYYSNAHPLREWSPETVFPLGLSPCCISGVIKSFRINTSKARWTPPGVRSITKAAIVTYSIWSHIARATFVISARDTMYRSGTDNYHDWRVFSLVSCILRWSRASLGVLSASDNTRIR